MARGEPEQARGRNSTTSWIRATALAALMIVVSVVVFAVVPDRLLGYLTVRVAPNVRDLLVTLWWVVAFVGACFLFVRLQLAERRS
jgi:hypothetical protein